MLDKAVLFILEQFALPCVREVRISLELILKPELVLSNTEKSHHSTSFRTGSSKNAVHHEAGPANQFERCSGSDAGEKAGFKKKASE